MSAAPQAAFTFDAEKHEYRNAAGRPIPSITQVLDLAGLVDFSMVRPEVLEKKRQIGDAAHASCHYLDTGDDLDWDTVAEEVVPYVLAYEHFRDDLGFKPRMVERRGVATINGVEVGYCIDREGTVSGMPFLVELKCGSQEETSWRIQLAGYELCLPKPEGHAYYGRAAVQLRDNGTYKIFKYEDRNDKEIFKACLAVATFKLNDGWKIK